MQIFLTENGQKTGPFTLWDVRGRLERKELSPDTPGWHEGCESWLPLRALPALGYREEDTDDFPAPLPNTAEQDGDARPEDSAGTAVPRPFSRFTARWFDLTLWFVLVALALKAFNISFVVFLQSASMQLASLILFSLSEAACLAIAGTTPGKAIWGLRVRSLGQAHGPLAFPVAMQRTLYVFALGNALLLNIFATIVAWAFHCVVLFKVGSTWWDRALQLEVTAKPITAARVLAFFLAIIGLQAALQMLVGKEIQPLIEAMLKSGQLP